MERKQGTQVRQTATAETTIRVSQQQLLTAQLLELGEDALMERVENELNENVVLEEGRDKDSDSEDDAPYEDDVFDEGRSSDDPSAGWDDDSEELPVYTAGGGESRSEIPLGDTKSFVDELLSQTGDHEMADEKQEELVRYLIGSLNDNGFIDRPLPSISDDLLFNHNVDASVEELEAALNVLQQFDPAGIGARDLRECMQLQLDRKISDTPKAGNLHRLMVLGLARQAVTDYFDLFKNNERQKLKEKLDVPDDIFSDVLDALHKLNPRPGLSLNEGSGDRSHRVVPDFIIETSVDGNISFSLRGSRIPPLRVSRAYQELIAASSRTTLSASQKEDLKYVKSNVERAENFIEALRKRRDTLYRTMHAIIQRQRAFMLSQDDSDLLPLTGGEIAKAVGVDGSTISRAVSSRYALLDGTLYPLKQFFLRTRRNAEGEEVMKTQVASMLQDVIDGEDKSNPLSDSEISDILIGRGLNIRRRTVAKYRDQLGIPVAKLRRK